MRRYGSTVESVRANFDARAMNELGFQKTGEWKMPWEEFEAKYERRAGHELVAQAEGDVQHEAEEKVLADLLRQLNVLESAAGDGQLVMIESETAKNYPKLREKQTTKVVGTANRLHFERTVDPPLRVGTYAERAS